MLTNLSYIATAVGHRHHSGKTKLLVLISKHFPFYIILVLFFSFLPWFKNVLAFMGLTSLSLSISGFSCFSFVLLFFKYLYVWGTSGFEWKCEFQLSWKSLTLHTMVCRAVSGFWRFDSEEELKLLSFHVLV